MKKTIHLIICLLIPVLVFVSIVSAISYYIQNVYVPQEEILKTAVKKSELRGEKYILCKEVMITGYDWRVIRNENGKTVRKLCNVVDESGDKYLIDIGLSAEFYLAKNTFIFYVKESREYIDENDGEVVAEYVVTGWDILYPIRHSDVPNFLNLFEYISNYITKKDLA